MNGADHSYTLSEKELATGEGMQKGLSPFSVVNKTVLQTASYKEERSV